VFSFVAILPRRHFLAEDAPLDKQRSIRLWYRSAAKATPLRAATSFVVSWRARDVPVPIVATYTSSEAPVSVRSKAASHHRTFVSVIPGYQYRN
jgi:hypothetical protein